MAWLCQSSLFTSLASISTAFLFSHCQCWIVTGSSIVFIKLASLIITACQRIKRTDISFALFSSFWQSRASARARMCPWCHFLLGFKQHGSFLAVCWADKFFCAALTLHPNSFHFNGWKWNVTSTIFLGHKCPGLFFANLKRVGGRKSLSALKRDSFLPRPRSRSCLLRGCQYWSSYIPISWPRQMAFDLIPFLISS